MVCLSLFKKKKNIIEGRSFYITIWKLTNIFKEAVSSVFKPINTCIGWQVYSQIYTLYPATTYTVPLHNPASPESVQTGDILCCIWFEIISYNRWVLFPEPASQSGIAPRALVAPKILKATHASGLVQLSSRCPPKLQTHLCKDVYFFFFPPCETAVGACFSFPLLLRGVNACLVFLRRGAVSERLVGVTRGAAATGGKQSGCALYKWAGDQQRKRGQAVPYESRYASAARLNSSVPLVCPVS